MNKLQQFIVWAGVVGGLAVAAPVGAAPISFVSGAGVAWTSDNDAVCGGPAACGGSTVAITPHGAWQGNNPDGSAAVWASYANTGVTGSLAPINQPDNGLLMSLSFNLDSVAGTPIDLKVWADDTARIWFNGVQAQAPNLTQSTCANGIIGCEPREFGLFNWNATGNDVVRIDVYQVGTTTTPQSNPFGVLYYGSFEQRQKRDVPEPTTLVLMGLGLFGVATAARRKR